MSKIITSTLTSTLLILAFTATTAAQSIDETWDTAETPPKPKIESVTVNAENTALLVLDFEELTCNQDRRPRCLETVPRIANLLDRARKAGMVVIHSQTSRKTPFLAPVTPKANEPVVASSVDKFYGTTLESILKAKGIKTVIVTGTAAHGAVMHTATAAGFRGLNVILPVDCLSASSLYIEQASVHLLETGPGTRRVITLTKHDMITIE